jgi:hypothetical protein
MDSISIESEHDRDSGDEVFSELESDDVDESDMWDCQKVRIFADEPQYDIAIKQGAGGRS